MTRWALIAPLVALAACTGSAEAATHTWQVGDFSRIQATGPFDVRVRTGLPSGVRATGPQDLIDRLLVEQHGDTLVVGVQRTGGWSNWSWRKSDPLIVEVGARTLAAAALTGSGNLAIDRVRGDALDLAVRGSGDLSVGTVEVARLKLSANGSGDLTAAGHAGTADAGLFGSGDIHGDKLIADEATATLVGSGDLAIGARRHATANLQGSGDITIAGPAACTVTRHGSGDVRCQGRTTGAD